MTAEEANEALQSVLAEQDESIKYFIAGKDVKASAGAKQLVASWKTVAYAGTIQ